MSNKKSHVYILTNDYESDRYYDSKEAAIEEGKDGDSLYKGELLGEIKSQNVLVFKKSKGKRG